MSKNLPADAQVVIDGSYYKIGLRNMIFVWANDWFRSQKPYKDVKGLIDEQNRRLIIR